MGKGKKAKDGLEGIDKAAMDGSSAQADGESAEGEESIDSAAEDQESELDRLHRELDEARAQAAEYLDGWQRAQAEFANFRKRKEAEWCQMTSRANGALLLKLLPVVDDFGRAIATVPDDLKQANWVDGVLLVKRKLDGILESEGVEAFECEGEDFDPRYHDAVAYEEAEGYDEGKVFQELQRGYMFGERVLRPALVRVAKAPATAHDDMEATSQNKE